MSDPSLIYPNAPINSPEAQSVAGGEASTVTDSLGMITEKLESLPNSFKFVTPPASAAGSNGKPKHVSYVKGVTQRFSRVLLGVSVEEGTALTHAPAEQTSPSRRISQVTVMQAEGGVPEHSKWEDEAEEAMARGLKTLSMLAVDEHNQDPSKSAKEYYSERLAALIKDGEIEFDAKYLG